MKKGITPVVAIVLLLIIAVAVVGIGYGFIIGFFQSVTGKAAIVPGKAACDTSGGDGNVSIPITNAGEQTITGVDVVVVATGGGADASTCKLSSDVSAGTTGTITSCKCTTVTCTFDVAVAGVVFPTRADC